ncbi:RagB/SusD family nutrient uptake outer membrane protein [Membranihabitans marinus]|uniref:RagB/SusD family nutrient uptake outer membrane protein n=1 Tax=Membranihabitans marinus TaxID=1227546 RepID=UPI001F180A18|nr:RagB/SusD family nutrient uptake outer membrane protein [Membranihabitans marinus]
MKVIITISIIFLTLFSCTDLNLNPLSQGSSDNWYSNETEISMSINDLYSIDFWDRDSDSWTDDWMNRTSTTEITNATINGQFSAGSEMWNSAYTCIARANTILDNLPKVAETLPSALINLYEANARFVRASKYAQLISHWGDVVFYTSALNIEESFALGRTDKEIILESIYEDYDYAAEFLPVQYENSENEWATKGAALGMKARIALYMGDFDIASDAAKACIDLEAYTLYPDFGELFQSSTRNANESIFNLSRSAELGEFINDWGATQNDYSGLGTKFYITRNAGGSTSKNPTWDLFCSFLCTDGLPIDESPLFNSREPFKNRDPRCSETIVEFQTEHLGYMFQPHPDSVTCYSFKSGTYVQNNDTRTVAQFTSYNGMVWKKGIDEDWADDYVTDPDYIILRYADVLLMYAEAKIELNEIDDSVINAINTVRARAYGVDVSETTSYPAVEIQSQAELRRIVRTERRMEFALEGLRYMDLIRWRLAEKTLNLPNYGMLDVIDLKANVVDKDLWFFPATPEVDEDGVTDFEPLFQAGFVRVLNQKTFDASRQYLWPIPSKEILINENIVQNPGY